MADDAGAKPDPAREETGMAGAWLRQKADPGGAAARAKQWAEENAASIASFNRYVEEHGVFGEEWRLW